MKDYTITLPETDVKRIMIALHSREGYFRRKSAEQENDFAQIYKSIADDYKRLFEMFNAL